MPRTIVDKHLGAGLIFVCLIWFASCRNQPNQTSTEKTSSPTAQIEALKLEMDSSWQVMQQSDLSKFSNMERLAEELKLIQGSDNARIESIIAMLKAVDSVRYNPITISESARIDRFDSATNSVWMNLRNEVSKNKNADKYQIVHQLITEIQQADDSVLFYRKAYDHKVDAFNIYFKQNKKELKRDFPGFDTLRPYPVFRLVQ